jgi:hypothetical protein
MKKILQCPLVFFLFIMLAGCSESPTIVGKWKPVEMEMPGVPEQTKKEMLSKSALEFRNDSQYVSIGPDGKQKQGTYAFDEKNQTVIMNAGMNPGDSLQVALLGDNKMTLVAQGYKIFFEKQ